MGADAISKEQTREEIEFLDDMKRLVENPFFQKLVSAVEAERERASELFVKQIAFRGGEHAEPVNQRVVDYKRGFWNGAIYAVSQFPKQKAKDWDKFVASDNEESESS